MGKSLEFLIFKIDSRYYGINSDEIKKSIFNKNKTKKLNEDKNASIYCKIGEILNINKNIEYDTIIFVDTFKESNVAVYLPSIIDKVRVELADIMLMPEYVRKRETSLFFWGFINTKKGMVILITFSDYKLK